MKRFLRLLTITIIVAAVALIVLNFGLAWILVTGMTHPFCQSPPTLTGHPEPEEHWLETKDGIQIRVWYYPSQNGAAILSFGGMSGALGKRLPLADFLIREGYGVIQVDSRACAHPSVPVTQGHDELYDGEVALDFAIAQTEIDPYQIGVMGFSMGGATALRVAAHHPEIQAVVRDGGFSNLGALLMPHESQPQSAKFFQSTVGFFYKIRSGIDPWEVDPIADLQLISPRPVLLIYGELEADSGWEQYNESNNSELWIVPGGTHGGNHIVAPEEYQMRVLEFFDQTLLK